MYYNQKQYKCLLDIRKEKFELLHFTQFFIYFQAQICVTTENMTEF